MTENMTLYEKIGQMMMTGLTGTTLTPEFIKLVETSKIGNVILFSRNCESASQVSRLCQEIQSLIYEKTGHPAFIAVDQEGGMVSRMPEDGTTIPGAMAVAATGRTLNARVAGRITGEELLAMGVNMNIAPVLDINSRAENPVIGVRSYGDCQEDVTAFGIQMMEGLTEGGVMPVIKHFPGHGDTAVDSHLSLPVIKKTLSELETTELVPFKNAIECGAPCVMTTHILFPSIEKERIPATMSYTIMTELLKERLGFDGLIMTDCMEMKAIQDFYGTPQGTVGAIKAGVHIVTVSHTPQLVEASAQAIERAVLSGEIPERTIDEAVDKILKAKAHLMINDRPIPPLSSVGSVEHRKCVSRMSEGSITLVKSSKGVMPPLGERILFLGSHAYRSNLASDRLNKDFNFPEYMAGKMNGEGLLISANPAEEEIAEVIEKASGYDTIVLGLYNGHLNLGQIALANVLSGIHHQMIIVALRNPYDIGLIKGCAAALAIYEYTPLAFHSLTRVLRGELHPEGILPVRIALAEKGH